MQKIGINQNPYIYERQGISPVKQANSYDTNFLSSEYATCDTFTSQAQNKSDLRKELEEVKGQRGLIDGLWDGFKNLVGMKSGSNHVEKLIEQAEKGEISQEEAQEALEKYKEGQKTCVDVFADIASGLASALIFSAAIGGAVFTGGASLAVGLGLATTVGAGVKVGIKAGDALLTGKEYTGKDLLYDTATGSINGLLAPITNGIGNTVTKTIGKKLGLKIVQEGAEEATEQVIKQGIKQTAKNMVLNQTLDVAGGTVGKRALALGAGMAVDGALGGASDNMVRAALNGENVLKAGVEGAIGGLIMAPVIGGGFRVAGKAGRALNNKITMSKILPDGMSTKFKQGNVGDCALLSTIDGMMNNPATAKNFKKSITKTIAGDYNVRIGDQVVRVSKASLSDEMLSDKTGIRIFEQAYKQLTGNIDGGFADAVAKQFGLNPVHIANESITDELLDNLSKHQGDTVLSFGTLVDETGSITNAGGQRHYFTIKNIDADSKMVTVTSPVDTSKTIELSYDEVKALGISIDGGTIKELDLPNSVRNIDDVNFKGKKKANSQITNNEEISRIIRNSELDEAQINTAIARLYGSQADINTILPTIEAMGLKSEDFISLIQKHLSEKGNYDLALQDAIHITEIYPSITQSSYFTPFKLSLDEVDSIYKALKDYNLNKVIDILSENNLDMAIHCEDMFAQSSTLDNLTKLISPKKSLIGIDPANVLDLGEINGSKKRILLPNSGSIPNSSAQINAEDLIKSNMMTTDLIDMARQYGLSGSVDLNIKGATSFQTTFEEIISKIKTNGYESLSTYEIHALTDELQNLFDGNPQFRASVEKYIKQNNSKFRNIYNVVEFLKLKATPSLKKYNMQIEDHAIMRMLDRSALAIPDSSGKCLSLDELFGEIVKNAKQGKTNFTIGNQEFELIIDGNTIKTIILK